VTPETYSRTRQGAGQKALEAIALARQNEEMLGRAVAMTNRSSRSRHHSSPKPVFDEYGSRSKGPQPQQPQITRLLSIEVEQKMNALRSSWPGEPHPAETDEAPEP